MKDESVNKIEMLSEAFDTEQIFFEKYIEENGLDVNSIVTVVEKSCFSKEDIALLFNLDHTAAFNPFLFLITEMSEAIINMHKNIEYFDMYNLKKEILVFYFGVAHLVNQDKDLLMPVLGDLLETFDNNISLYIDESRAGKTNNIALFSKKLVNMLKFSANKEIDYEYACSIDCNEKVLNSCYMNVFLTVAGADKDKIEFLKHAELSLSQAIIQANESFFYEDMELFEVVIFDKIIELILQDFDSNSNKVFELVNYFRYEKDYYCDNVIAEDETGSHTSSKNSPETETENLENVKLKYVNMERLLKEKIIGQDVVIESVIQRLKIAEFGVSRDVGAKAVFLMVGPTGVGKTEVVKLISQNITDIKDNPNNLIRVDMSEYKEEHTVSKLIGAPPGYVGFETKEDTTVFDRVIKNPNAVILLDEIEKAHPGVLDVFLHVFDEGKATTNRQRKVDFSNNIIFMTSNIGTREANKNSVGFNVNEDRKSDVSKTYKTAIERRLRPEFINRINEIIIFNELDREQIKIILNNQIKNIEQKLKESRQLDIKILISEDAFEYLIDKMQYKKYGARDVRRIIERYVLNQIIELSMNNQIKNGILKIECFNGEMSCNYEETKVLRKSKKAK